MTFNGVTVDTGNLLTIAKGIYEETGQPVSPGILAVSAFGEAGRDIGGQGREKLRHFMTNYGIPAKPKRTRRWGKRPETVHNAKTPKFSLAAEMICKTIYTIIGNNEQLAAETLGFVVSKNNSCR